MRHKISASILCANELYIAQEIEEVIKCGVDGIHIDIMDNHYVPNIGCNPKLIKALREKYKSLTIDIHLMVSPIESLIKTCCKLGASSITFHVNATNRIEENILLIKSFDIQAGIAFKMDDDFNNYLSFLKQTDRILFMTVSPGFGGQTFIPESLESIKRCKEWLISEKTDVLLEADGGVNFSNIKKISDQGVDSFVIGSGLFGKKDYKSIIKNIREILSA